MTKIGFSRRITTLTPKERAVVHEVAQGFALKIIASHLTVSTQSVSTYLRRAQLKLGVSSRGSMLAVLGADVRTVTELLEARGAMATDAELAVGQAIALGRSYAAIAASRSTSVRTVQAQARSLFAKCGVGSRYHFIALLHQPTVDKVRIDRSR